MKKINKWLNSVVILSLLASSSAVYADDNSLGGYLENILKVFGYSVATSFGWESGKGLYRWARDHKLIAGGVAGAAITALVLKKLYDEQQTRAKVKGSEDYQPACA